MINDENTENRLTETQKRGNRNKRLRNGKFPTMMKQRKSQRLLQIVYSARRKAMLVPRACCQD
ncbi:hypothetical protein J6590_020587 [Homalodisca vitripennis]|nr:hypothetical protein J6590_020587 [Homalodisca vitripennis]